MREESAAVDSIRPGVDSTRTFIGAAAILKRMNANFGFVDFIFPSVPFYCVLKNMIGFSYQQWFCIGDSNGYVA